MCFVRQFFDRIFCELILFCMYLKDDKFKWKAKCISNRCAPPYPSIKGHREKRPKRIFNRRCSPLCRGEWGELAAREMTQLQYLANRSEKAPLSRISLHGSSLRTSSPNGFLFRSPAAEISGWSQKIDFLELHCNSVCRLFSEVIRKAF